MLDARAPLLAVKDLQAWYGESHILHGVTFDVRHGRGGDAARPQRRRQDHDAEIDHGHRRPAHRLGALRGPRTDRRAPPTRSRAPASPSARRSAASSRASTSRRICCCRRRCGRAACRSSSIFELFPNLKERLGSSQGTKLSGGEQQMLAIAPHPAHRRAAAAARRADRGAGAGHHPADRQDHPHAEGAGLHHPAGRAELPVRLDRRRPLLCDGARPRRRRLRQCGTGRQSRKAARLSRSLNERAGAPAAAQQGGDVNETSCEFGRARGRAGVRHRAGAADHRQDRRDERHVEPLCRHRRAGLDRRREAGGRRLQPRPIRT